MNVSLVPNIEPAKKYVDYFLRSAGASMVEANYDPDFLLVEGPIPTLNVSPELGKKPKEPVQIITPPEAAVQQAEKQIESRDEFLANKNNKRSHDGSDSSSTKSKKSKGLNTMEYADIFVG